MPQASLPPAAFAIAVDNLSDGAIDALMRDHLKDMYATSPPESVHALQPDALRASDVTFWSARGNERVLGCIALREIDELTGEIKSMRTAAAARGAGVGSALLVRLLDEARQRGYSTLYLETGSQDYFAPARRLYARHGFSTCGRFADYKDDPNSVFMRLALTDARPGP